MNKLTRAAIIGGAAIAVGVLPAASIASAATPPTPIPEPTAPTAPGVPTGSHNPHHPHAPSHGTPTHHRTPTKHRPRPTTGTTGKPSGGHHGTAPTHHPTPKPPVSHQPVAHPIAPKPAAHKLAQHKPARHKPIRHRPVRHHPVAKPPAPSRPVVHPPIAGHPVMTRETVGHTTPRIFGGQPVANAAWAAQVSWDSTGFQCTGSAIAAQWVLTARHCVDSGGMTVLIGSTHLGEGTKATVDKKIVDPVGDLALLHLSEPVRTSYIRLADADPQVGQINTIYGFGKTDANSGPADQLRSARVRVNALDCLDAQEGRAICTTGITGTANNGDSGGPEVAGGVEVGVCSTGDDDAETQQYASVAANRAWIRAVARV